MNSKVQYIHFQMEPNLYTETQIIMYHKVTQVMLSLLGTNTQMEE